MSAVELFNDEAELVRFFVFYEAFEEAREQYFGNGGETVTKKEKYDAEKRLDNLFKPNPSKFWEDNYEQCLEDINIIEGLTRKERNEVEARVDSLFNEFMEGSKFRDWLTGTPNWRNTMQAVQEENMLWHVGLGEEKYFSGRKYPEENTEETGDLLEMVGLIARVANLFASAIYLYLFANKRSGEWAIRRGFASSTKISSRSRKKAGELKESLQSDGVTVSHDLLFALESIEAGLTLDGMGAGVPRSDIPLRRGTKPLTDNQLRRVIVREVTLLGQKYWLPERSDKGRFSPKIVLEVLDLLGYSYMDPSSLNRMMNPYDLETGQNVLRELWVPNMYHRTTEYRQQKMAFEPDN